MESYVLYICFCMRVYCHTVAWHLLVFPQFDEVERLLLFFDPTNEMFFDVQLL